MRNLLCISLQCLYSYPTKITVFLTMFDMIMLVAWVCKELFNPLYISLISIAPRNCLHFVDATHCDVDMSIIFSIYC